MTDHEGLESPSTVGAFILWQQPHPIYMAELAYGDSSSKEILEKYKDLVFGTAEFIIDDRDVENRRASIFVVSSNHEPYKVNTISSLKRNQERIPGKFPGPCLVTVVNSNVMHYIRYGLNQNNGSPQQDIFVVSVF